MTTHTVRSRGTVTIDVELCKGCDLCIPACPPAVLTMSHPVNHMGYHYPELHAGCTGCAACLLVCPDFVLRGLPLRYTGRARRHRRRAGRGDRMTATTTSTFAPAGERELMEGSEAIVRASIAAGCRFFAGYPMTPFTEVLEHSARLLPEVGGVCMNAESELEAVGMAWGAAAAGARAATGSTGQGLSLMQESLSELTLAEVPLVVINMSRSQGDYFQATRGGGHGDYRHIVVAPQDVREAIELTQLAFHLADKWRNPVLLYGDYLLAHTQEAVTVERRDFRALPAKEWAVDGSRTGSGSSRAVTPLGVGKPGQRQFGQEGKAQYIASKLPLLEREVRVETGHLDDAETVIVAFGTPAKFVKYAIDQLRADGQRIGYVRPITLWPFPYEAVHAAAADARSGRLLRGLDRTADRRRTHRRRRPGAGRAPRRRLDRRLRVRRSAGCSTSTRCRDAHPRPAPRRDAADGPRVRGVHLRARSPTSRRRHHEHAPPRPTTRTRPRHPRRPDERRSRRRGTDARPADDRGAFAVSGVWRTHRDARVPRSHHGARADAAGDRGRRDRLLHRASAASIDVDLVQALHGRAPSVATGVKRMLPDVDRLHAPGRRRHGQRRAARGAPHRRARRAGHVHPPEQRRVRGDRWPHDLDERDRPADQEHHRRPRRGATTATRSSSAT